MARYDHGGGCPCGLEKICDCGMARSVQHSNRRFKAMALKRENVARAHQLVDTLATMEGLAEDWTKTFGCNILTMSRTIGCLPDTPTLHVDVRMENSIRKAIIEEYNQRAYEARKELRDLGVVGI